MGKVIAISNAKGGVAKSTTTSALGKALSLQGKRVLLVDIDSQGDLTSLYLKETPRESTIFGSLVARRPISEISISKNLYLVPSSEDMIGIDEALTTIYQEDKEKRVSVLKDLLKPIRGNYDYILIDCPPSIGIATKNGLVASDGVIVPVVAESLPAQRGLFTTLETIELLRSNYNPRLRLFGILITRYNRRRINRIVETGLRGNQDLGDFVFETKIRENVDVSESPLYGKDIFDYSPDSRGAQDYAELAKEIIKKL